MSDRAFTGTRVGVTGHRSLPQGPALGVIVDKGLNQVGATFGGPLTIVSPLAEGADQLVVKRARALGHFGLIVPLPFPREKYLAGFSTPEGRDEFDRLFAEATETIVLAPREDDVAAYQAVGHWVLDHCDVVFAIWNGRPPRSVAGTGAIVENARARRLPLVWVDPAKPEHITTERFDAGDR